MKPNSPRITIILILFFSLLQAGCDSKKLLIALEPEVASIFCQFLDENETTDEQFMQFPVGMRYLILDAGGKTQAKSLNTARSAT